MKAFLFIILSTFTTVLSFSQNEISWTFSYNKDLKQLEMKATLQKGWHIYSARFDNDGGPVKTEFEFEIAGDAVLVGEINEPTPIEEFDPNFDMTVRYFSKEVIFSQGIKFKKTKSIKGSVVYMICNDQMCLPPVSIPFEIQLKK